jgi:hypothetical protein
MRSIRAVGGWRSIVETVRGLGKSGNLFEVWRNCRQRPGVPRANKYRETLAMNDVSQFATAMLALFFVGALLVTGQLFIEQRAQRDAVYATTHLVRPL